LLSGSAPFVAVDRADGPSDEARTEAFGKVGVVQSQLVKEDHPANFYLAIHKDELHQRWFLSAYVRNMFPGAVFGGAARSLDLKVVSFRRQNDKVFLVDADDRKKTSDLFDPAILIDAFPIISDYAPFNALPGAENYYLIDPAAGLNQFTLVGDLFGSGFGARLSTELSFVQGFRVIEDGITYEQVFTAYAEDPDEAAWSLWENPFRVAGTLGMAIRRYEETP